MHTFLPPGLSADGASRAVQGIGNGIVLLQMVRWVRDYRAKHREDPSEGELDAKFSVLQRSTMCWMDKATVCGIICQSLDAPHRFRLV